MIIRRKLFAYTVLFTAGISAGFYIFERTRLAGGFLVMASAGAVICLAAGQDTELIRKLTAWLAAGFLLFTFRYLYYGTSLITQEQPDGSSQAATVQGTEQATEQAAERVTEQATELGTDMTIEGFVRSAVITDGKLKLTLKDTDTVRKGVGVLVSLRDAEGYDPADIIGRRVRVYGRLREPSTADNPGCFDYRVYLRSKGTGYMFSARGLNVDQDSISLYGRYRRRLYLARERFLDLFNDDQDSRSFIKGTVFGDKSDIDEQVRDEFSMNGTGHILAVSGLHTGFLYALLRLITGRKRTLPAAVSTIAVLILYGEMTMWSPSAMRAVTVLTVSLMSTYVRRPFDLLSSVSAAALLILVMEPYQLFSTGFQLSFIALLGICFLSGPLEIFIGEWLAVPVAVQAAVLPLTGFIFHRINVLSIFINIPVIFMASVLVPACMTALMFSLAAGTVPRLMIMVIEGLTDVVVRFNRMTSAGGYFSDLVSSGGLLSGPAEAIGADDLSYMITAASAGLLFLFYLLIFISSSEWFRVKLLRHERGEAVIALICAAAIAGCVGITSYNSFADDEIVFVSVGQGDCTHIRAGERNVLIDGGGSLERNIGKDVLMPYLLANGAEKAELCLVTHLHTDHCLGIFQLDEVYPVGAVGIPADYMRSIESLREEQPDELPYEQSDEQTEQTELPENIEFIRPGSRISVTDDVYIEPVWPARAEQGSIDIDDPNENNMVYIVYYKGVKIMVTGDLLEEDELAMIDYYRGTDVLDCDILKVAHHGSKSSSSEDFLDAVTPEIAVIQVGAGNFYGHPHQQTLDRLEERGITIYRTDLNGAVGIDIRRGRRLYVDLCKSAGSFKQ